MAEQQSTYQTAMNEAASAAWDQDWQTAARSYGRALQSKPDDPQALAGIRIGKQQRAPTAGPSSLNQTILRLWLGWR